MLEDIILAARREADYCDDCHHSSRFHHGSVCAICLAEPEGLYHSFRPKLLALAVAEYDREMKKDWAK